MVYTAVCRSSLFLCSSQGIFLFPCWSILWFCSILLMFDQKICLTCFSGHFIVSNQVNFNFKSWDDLNSYGQYPPLLQSRHLSLKPGHNTLGVLWLIGVEFLGKSCTGSLCFCKDHTHHLQHTGMECDTGMQAQAWLRWEMGLSFFSTSPFVVSWDGQQYLTIPSPQVWKIFLSLRSRKTWVVSRCIFTFRIIQVVHYRCDLSFSFGRWDGAGWLGAIFGHFMLKPVLHFCCVRSSQE